MGYRVRFEKASVILDGSKITVNPDDGESYEVTLEKKDRMAEEIRLIASCIADENVKNTSNPPESALMSVKLVEALCKSADMAGEKVKFN